MPVARWIVHRVIPGERLAEIANRYRVEVAQVLEWNELDDRPMLRAGQKLRILTPEAAVERRRIPYTVKEGDSWPKIARRFDVGLDRLRDRWNPGVAELLPGDQIIIWREVESRAPDAPAAGPSSQPAMTAELPKAAAPAPAPANSTDLAKIVELPTQPQTRAELAKVAPPRPAPKPAAPASVAPVPQPPRPTPKPALASVAPAPQRQPQPAATPVARTPAATQVARAPMATTTASVTLAKVTTTRTPAKAALGKVIPRPPIRPAPELVIIPVRDNGMSLGSPARGRLRNGVQLPRNDALYRIRNPAHSFGSSHMVEQLQRALARFRSATGFDREILIADMSRQKGGRFRPHESHRSGRDVDIQLPMKRGVPPNTIPEDMSVVDWDAAWALVKALVAGSEVKYIFLSRSRQRPLYEAAKRAGESEATLEEFIEFPNHSRKTLVRHSQGHVKHMHVRFTCGAQDTLCRD